MTRTKSIIGALVLCAVSICAFAAASASASELTAVTCKNTGAVNGQDEHCTTGTTGGKFETVALPVGTTTSIEGTSTEEPPTLRGTAGGLNVTIKCEVSHQIEAWIKNTEPSAGKHKIDYGGKLTYTNCEAMLKSKETRTCKVEEITGGGAMIGMITTNLLEGETTGVEHKVVFRPAPGQGGIFAEFNILEKGKGGNECPFGADVKVKVEGSVEGEANTTNHSHLTFTEANNGTGLEANGLAAKYLDTVGANMAGEPTVTVGATTFT